MIPFEMPPKNPKTILQKARRYAKKSLGQHFLYHPNIAQEMVKLSCISNMDRVIEIGPGLGALTLPLGRVANKVFAIDIDSHLLELLSIELKNKDLKNVDLIHEDILKMPFITIMSKNAFLPEDHGRWIVIGNLPYHISSQIIVKLIKERQGISQAIVMLQKEMAERICSTPGSKAYGRLSVMLQYCSKITSLIEIKGCDFFPRVKVDSQVIQIQFNNKIDQPVHNENALFQVVKAAFGKRRKKIYNALRSGLSYESSMIKKALHQADIDSIRRAETLTVNDFVNLTNALAAIFGVL
jgi:16S rRNA (adenine1518-N6/adenine1519-N6)-dimethyltransferase